MPARRTRRPRRARRARRAINHRPGRAMAARYPTFVETVQITTLAANAGYLFGATMDWLPQLSAYTGLYKEYRINWVEIKLLPQHNVYDGSTTISQQGMPRISWSVDNSPGLTVPVNEQQVLTQNGAKTRPLLSSWSCRFRPVPDIAVLNAGSGAAVTIPMRNKFLAFASGVPNVVWNGVSAFISQSLAGGASPGAFTVYGKVSFSLRQPM